MLLLTLCLLGQEYFYFLTAAPWTEDEKEGEKRDDRHFILFVLQSYYNVVNRTGGVCHGKLGMDDG